MFDRLYRGEPTFDGAPAPTGIPWDVGHAQPRLMELEALGGISGEVLDIGCGLGYNAIFLASRGYSVTALDSSAAAIERAGRNAAEAGVRVTFDVADATNLTGYDGRFDTVVDSGLYHCLDDDGRRSYAAGLHRATTPLTLPSEKQNRCQRAPGLVARCRPAAYDRRPSSSRQ